MRLEGIVGQIVRAEVPVQMPHVLPPPEDLADEALGRRQRRRAVAVGPLGGTHGVQRMQYTQIQRHRQQRVRHRPVAAHHGVLVAAEQREPIGDEPRERAAGLGRGDGEQARSVDSDGVDAQPVEVPADFVVDIVLARPVGRRDVERRAALGR